MNVFYAKRPFIYSKVPYDANIKFFFTINTILYKMYVGCEEMKVIIIEDNQVHLTALKSKLFGMQIKLNIDFEIIIPANKEDLLYINSNFDGVINIINIFDVNNGDFNGILLASEIRKITRESHIIFLTSHEQYLQDAVNSNVEPLAFISKTNPNLLELLTKAFIKILYINSNFENSIKLQFTDQESNRIFISNNNILLIYTNPTKQKYLILETLSDTYSVKGEINKLKSIHQNLVLCNKSTIVNKKRIQKIIKGTNPKNKTIILENHKDKVLPKIILSKLYKSDFL